MEKDLRFIELFDLYSGLLTEKQKEIFSAYYIYDLSLSEIAEPQGRTRQSVHEIIKNTCDKLLQYEKTLKLKSKNDKLYDVALSTSDKNASDKIKELIGR